MTKRTVLFPSVFYLLLFLFGTAQAVPPPQTLPQVKTYDQLVRAIRETRVASRFRIETLVKQEKVREAWETGKLIDEHVLLHKERAEYDRQVINRLAKDLDTNETELRFMVQFARAYPIHWPADELSWSHYQSLLALNDSRERDEVAKVAVCQKWTRDQVREEVRRRKSRSGAVNENKLKLSEIKPGKTGVYRIVEQNGHPCFDLGFDIYYDLPEKDAGRFKGKDEDLYTYKARVTDVYDGDTFHALIDLGFGIKLQQRLRLRRLDAPEILSAEGKEAKAVLRKMLPPDVIIKVSRVDDQYGRYLADVFTPDLVSIDQKLLDSGVFTLRGDER